MFPAYPLSVVSDQVIMLLLSSPIKASDLENGLEVCLSIARESKLRETDQTLDVDNSRYCDKQLHNRKS